MIENLAKEKKLLSDNLCARLDIATESSDDLKEIIEPYDEEKELAWKGTFFFVLFIIYLNYFN